jgi:hypothetical protein
MVEGQGCCPTCGRKIKVKVAEPATKEWPVPEALRALRLYAADGRLCVTWDQLMGAWRAAYPTLDILREVAAAHAWEVANPHRQKTSRGRPKFLTAWLERSQNRRGGNPEAERERQETLRRARDMDEAQRRRAEEARARGPTEGPVNLSWLLDGYRESKKARAQA